MVLNLGIYFRDQNYWLWNSSGSQKKNNNLGFLECRTEQVIVIIKSEFCEMRSFVGGQGFCFEHTEKEIKMMMVVI